MATNDVPGQWDSQSYSFDGAGNIIGIGTDVYTYDNLGRLHRAGVTSAGATTTDSYKHDAFGNLYERQTAGPSGTSTLPIPIDALTNQLTEATYDAAGNMEQHGAAHRYQWDSARMLSSRNDGQDVYIYTASDERIAVKSGETWKWSLRDLKGKVIREMESTGTTGAGQWRWVEDYVHRDGQVVGADRAAAEGGRRHMHLDHLGTPRLLTDASGQAISRHDYLPFGIELTSNYQERDRGDARENKLRFTGHERDFVNGTRDSADTLDYMHARYYRSEIARFLSTDPGKDWDPKEPQSWNLYGYVRNNPLMRTDPDGRSTLVFNRHSGYIALYSGEGMLIGAWPAANNADSGSRGSRIWPAGQYDMLDQTTPRTHASGDTVDGAYGTRGIFRAENFDDNGVIRSGMGVHAGRANDTDGAGRSGVEHATQGCVRTTEEAMEIIAETAPVDPIETIRIEDYPEPRTDLGPFGDFFLPIEDGMPPRP